MNRSQFGRLLLLWFALIPAAAADDLLLESVAPLLRQRCLECHNPNKREGGLSLDVAASVLQGGDSGPAIVAGKPGQSLLLQRIIDGDMPAEGEPLSENEIATLTGWIADGANWPEGLILREAAKADQSWWAYQPLADDLPGSDPVAAIDRLITERLSEAGLERNPPAERRDLIRRVTHDLTGLPPTPEDVEAFVNDMDPEAWPQLVDRLLASPRYGERWGRHWLDVVRFGESNGFERNVINDAIWPFRDYVIRSFNDDKPFDQFIIEHLAGDVVGAGNPEIEVGVAFLVAGPYDDVGNQDAMAQAIIRANTLDDPITATSSAFLALTVNCARCHDHKFDPIQQKDYYRLRATFEGVNQGQRVLTTAEQKQAHAAAVEPLARRRAELEKLMAELEDGIVARAAADPGQYLPDVTRPSVSRTLTSDEFEPVTAQFVRLLPLSNDTNPNGNGVRIDEIEVFTADASPRNVALAANGGVATADGRKVEDSADNATNAYGAVLVNDGRFGARWISAGDHTLTIRFAKPETINRVVYSSDRPAELPTHGKMVFVGEYRIEVSSDGEAWKTVSESWDREPLNDSFLRARYLRFATTDDEKQQFVEMRRERNDIDRQLAAIPPLPQVWVGRHSQPNQPTHLALGGDPNKPAEEIVPASFSTLANVVPAYQLTSATDEGQRRLEFAQWVVHDDNPLTPRVLANRVWHYHFGKGIVATPSDFGYMGGRPSHPELLDHLARRLKHHGWQLKPLHREILLTQTYQQSADWNEAAAGIDADSRLLWRFPPRRLSAEELRDSILQLAGKLDLKMGGPGFRLYQFTQDNVCTYHPLDEHGPDTWRRAVYHQNPRAANADLLTEFDCPDPATAAPRRVATTTPLQALTLMNHSFTVDMAGFFAERLRSSSDIPADQIRAAFRLAYGRLPSQDEMSAALQLVDRHDLDTLTRAVINSNELIYVR